MERIIHNLAGAPHVLANQALATGPSDEQAQYETVQTERATGKANRGCTLRKSRRLGSAIEIFQSIGA